MEGTSNQIWRQYALDPMSDKMFDEADLDEAEFNPEEETPAIEPDEEFIPEENPGK